MVTPIGERTLEFRGLSTDQKPSKKTYPKLGNGSTFMEMDTANLFMYDEEHDT